MTTLVLGASGFIGSWVARVLAARGGATTVLVRPASDLWRLQGVSGLDVVAAPEPDWSGAIADVRPATIVSLDWSGVAGANRNDHSQWSNIDRQHEVLAVAAESGTRRFVGVGSQAEYGPKTELITESLSANPVTGYGEAKLAAMASSREICAEHGIEWVWARIFSVYGPLDHGHWLLPLVADALRHGRDIELTTGEQQWSYLYAFDAGTALATLATHPDAEGIYNVGNPAAPRLRETLETFAAHYPASRESSIARLLFGARAFEPNPVMRLEPDVSRLEALGWSASVGMDDGLATTMSWLLGRRLDDPTQLGRSLPTR